MKKIVAVIGPNQANSDSATEAFGIELGQSIIDQGYRLACGGRQGLMLAVCKGARQSTAYCEGDTLAILPGHEKSEANPYCDIVIPTGIGLARNQIVVLSADVVIAVAGGAGTLSEMAFAWQHQKPVICYTGLPGWASELAGKDLDSRSQNLMKAAPDLPAIHYWLKQLLGN